LGRITEAVLDVPLAPRHTTTLYVDDEELL
jgi:hypothetical protein